MTPADYIALLGIALPLAAKVAVDIAAYLTSNKHAALANIVGMAGREAATIARTLASNPTEAAGGYLERKLITDSVSAILTRMGDSATADSDKVAGIVQGELDKLVVAPVAVLPLAPLATTAGPASVL
jgi:hypothetical protein